MTFKETTILYIVKMFSYLKNSYKYYLNKPSISNIIKLEGWEILYDTSNNDWYYNNPRLQHSQQDIPYSVSNSEQIIDYFEKDKITRSETKVLLQKIIYNLENAKKINEEINEEINKVINLDNVTDINQINLSEMNDKLISLMKDYYTIEQSLSNINTVMNKIKKDEKLQQKESEKFQSNVLNIIGIVGIGILAASTIAHNSNYNESQNKSNNKSRVGSVRRSRKISSENALFTTKNLEYEGANIYTVESKDIFVGPRGGRYYYNDSGNKIYI